MISAENKPVTVTAMTGARNRGHSGHSDRAMSLLNGCLNATRNRQRQHSRRKARCARCSRGVTATATASNNLFSDNC